MREGELVVPVETSIFAGRGVRALPDALSSAVKSGSFGGGEGIAAASAGGILPCCSFAFALRVFSPAILRMALRLFEYSSSVIRGLVPVLVPTPGGNICCLKRESWGIVYVLAMSLSIRKGSARQSDQSGVFSSAGLVVTVAGVVDDSVVTAGTLAVVVACG